MELTFYHSEFEEEVRNRLGIFNRQITDEDAQTAEELDLSTFTFKDEDIETLFQFKNLKILNLESWEYGFLFWSHFPELEELYWCCLGNNIDFKVFAQMHNLECLCVSGGDCSGINFKNPDALIPLKKLEYLELHEFGTVDIEPFGRMPQLKSLALRYADEVKNINTIGTMTWLKELILDGLHIENLDFLDYLSDDTDIDMCGIYITDCDDTDVKKWNRFKNIEVDEIIIEKDGHWKYVDLSEFTAGS